MAESPEEKQALENLDEATREVAWGEFDKEADRELNTGWGFGRLARFGRRLGFRRVKGDPVREPVDDKDPGDERGLRDVLHEGDEKN